MHDSMAANRGLALRAAIVQALAAMMISLAYLERGIDSFQAAAFGGGAVVLGGLLLAWRSFRMQSPSAGFAMLGLLTGIALKWLVLLAVSYLALVGFGLPALPFLVGVVGTVAAFLFIGKINVQVSK